jgi:hypothetical protein
MEQRSLSYLTSELNHRDDQNFLSQLAVTRPTHKFQKHPHVGVPTRRSKT